MNELLVCVINGDIGVHIVASMGLVFVVWLSSVLLWWMGCLLYEITEDFEVIADYNRLQYYSAKYVFREQKVERCSSGYYWCKGSICDFTTVAAAFIIWLVLLAIIISLHFPAIGSVAGTIIIVVLAVRSCKRGVKKIKKDLAEHANNPDAHKDK